MNNRLITLGIDEIDADRKFTAGATKEECISKMEESYKKSIDFLGQNQNFSVERFKDFQESIVIGILSSYLEGVSAYILEAPTGVGKSIIGLVVELSLQKYHDFVNDRPFAYCLTSSKMLQDQLEKDKDLYELNWEVLKGQDNYFCNVNSEPFKNRDCKDMSITSSYSLSCSSTCDYMIRRSNAMNMNCAILSYAYWLTTMNFVYEYAGSFAPFHPRVLTIFDECHMLPDIVGDMFKTTVSNRIVYQLEKIHEHLIDIGCDDKILEKSLYLREKIKESTEKLMKESNSVAEAFEILRTDFYENVNLYSKLCQYVCNKYLPPEPKYWTKSQRLINLNAETIFGYAAKIFAFIKENSERLGYLVKTLKDENQYKTLIIRSLLESTLCKEHVHRYCNFSLYMSATIGDCHEYAKQIGLDNYRVAYVDSRFDFSKSPIITVGPPLSMAYKNKDKNIDELFERILHLTDNLHPNERGIIHTGNYDITTKLKNYVWSKSKTPRRYLFYKDSTEKANCIAKVSVQSNAIIVGPSLLEGLDMKDDLARFAIFAKVPYPAIDEYSERKMKMEPGWYGMKTMQSVMQGIGRGVRHKSDWCVTYFMDSCFNQLFSNTKAPSFITSRFAKMNVGILTAPKVNEENLFDYDLSKKKHGDSFEDDLPF